jgi:putative SOS response-associated peptidase YedK
MSASQKPRSNIFLIPIRDLLSTVITMDAVKRAAVLHERTVQEQAEHWLRLGRAAERALSMAEADGGLVEKSGTREDGWARETRSMAIAPAANESSH